MDAKILVVIAISEAVSCFLGYRLLKRKESVLEKIGLVVVLLVPVFGPIFYLFLAENVPPNNPLLRDKGRGGFTHWMIGLRADLEAREKRESEKEPDSGEAASKKVP